TRIFELDSIPTQERKRRCIRKARIEIPKHVTFVPIDFNQESLRDVLERSGYKNNQKTLFVWEGVSNYLQVDSVDSTLEFVSHASHHESSIAFDYTLSISEENINDFYGVKEFNQTMKEYHADEELMFSIDEGETESFLHQRGLKMVDHLDNEEIERAFLMDEDGSLIGRMTGHFRFVVASPEK
ncbi:MAG: SAM-dependent methyltransferase, partial [Anaerolineales bacterium]